MVLALTLMLLAAAPDAGTAAAPSGETVALIWGGGKEDQAVRVSLGQWEVERKLLQDLLVFAPGFPRVVSSDKVPGLNPGLAVVLLGFCGRDEARPARAYLKALYPFTYEKPVKGQAPACPTWKKVPLEDPEEPHERTVSKPKTVKFQGGTLTVVSLSVPGPGIDETSLGEPVPVQWLSVVARDEAGALVNVYTLRDERSYIAGPRNIGCDTSVKSVKEDAVVLERDCNGTSGACQSDPGEVKRVSVYWDGKKFHPVEKVLKEWSGTGCAE